MLLNSDPTPGPTSTHLCVCSLAVQRGVTGDASVAKFFERMQQAIKGGLLDVAEQAGKCVLSIDAVNFQGLTIDLPAVRVPWPPSQKRGGSELTCGKRAWPRGGAQCSDGRCRQGISEALFEVSPCARIAESQSTTHADGGPSDVFSAGPAAGRWLPGPRLVHARSQRRCAPKRHPRPAAFPYLTCPRTYADGESLMDQLRKYRVRSISTPCPPDMPNPHAR